MLIFYFREAFKSISRAKASFILTFISLGIAVILLIALAAAFQLSSHIESKLKENITLSIFLNDDLKESDISLIKGELESKEYITAAQFISKDRAAEIFIQETGENFKEILDYNPLPASFNVVLNFARLNKDSLNKVTEDLSGYEWVDEVVYKNTLIYNIINYIDKSKLYLAGIAVFVVLVALYLVYTTIKLITNSRMKEIETMKLVGAKLSTIKIPIILNGLFAGLLAGLLALLIFLLLFSQIKSVDTITSLINQNQNLYLLLLILTGPVLSFIVTIYALRKVSLKI